MGFIDNDSEVQVSERTTYGFQDELELVDGCDDNLLTSLQGLSQRGRVFCPGNNVGKALEGVDVVPDLLVQIDAVRNHDDGIHDVLVILHQCDELICQPGNGVALARACTMLNQEALTNGVRPGFKEEFPDTIQLVIAGPDDLLHRFGLAFFLFLNDLCVVLQDVSKRVFL